MAVRHAFEHVLEIGKRLDVIELAVAMSEATVAQRVAPPSEPANPRARAIDLIPTNSIATPNITCQHPVAFV